MLVDIIVQPFATTMSATMFILAVVLPPSLSLASYQMGAPEWIKEVPWGWGKINAVAGVVGTLAGVALNAVSGAHDLRVVIMAILAWLGAIVTITDYTAYYIPKKSSILAYLAAFAASLALYISSGSNHLLILSAVLFLVPSVFFFVTGMGMGDVRLLIFFALGMAWVGAEGWVAAFLLSAIVGLVSFLFASILGWGKKEEITTGLTKRLLGKLIGKDYPLTKKSKSVLPFGPALVYAFFAVGCYYLIRYGAELPTSALGYI